MLPAYVGSTFLGVTLRHLPQNEGLEPNENYKETRFLHFFALCVASRILKIPHKNVDGEDKFFFCSSILCFALIPLQISFNLIAISLFFTTSMPFSWISFGCSVELYHLFEKSAPRLRRKHDSDFSLSLHWHKNLVFSICWNPNPSDQNPSFALAPHPEFSKTITKQIVFQHFPFSALSPSFLKGAVYFY